MEEIAAQIPQGQNPADVQTEAIIRKWYERLRFPQVFRREFEDALGRITVPETTCIDTYDLSCTDGERNLLSFLYMCQAVEEKYRELGIGEDILLDTLQDIVRWTERWSEVKGHLCLYELEWLARHMRVRLFKVGRLQFYMAPAKEDIPACGISRGDNVVELHIHRGGKLTPQAVDDSLSRGKTFLQTYFPQYRYQYFTCHSWLLDETLRKYLPENSNILRFGDRFQRIYAVDSDILLRFLFRWDTCPDTLAGAVCETAFQHKIKTAVLQGEQFHAVLGVLAK